MLQSREMQNEMERWVTQGLRTFNTDVFMFRKMHKEPKFTQDSKDVKGCYRRHGKYLFWQIKDSI